MASGGDIYGQARQLKERAVAAGMSEQDVKDLNIGAKIGRDREELVAKMAEALPFIEDAEKDQERAKKELIDAAGPNISQVAALDVEAETIREAKLLPEHEQTQDMYDTYYASNDLRYVNVNTAAKIAGERNSRDEPFYRRLGYGRLDITPSNGKLLRLVYLAGHPENPLGGETVITDGHVLMAMSIATAERQDQQRIQQSGMDPEKMFGNDRTVSFREMRPGQAMVQLDRGYVDQHGHVNPSNLADHLPTATDMAQRQRDAARRAKQLENVDEKFKAHTGNKLSDAIEQAFEDKSLAT